MSQLKIQISFGKKSYKFFLFDFFSLKLFYDGTTVAILKESI